MNTKKYEEPVSYTHLDVYKRQETYSQPRKEPYCQRVCNPKF